MSPKSMTPETRCSASNRQLSGVRSLWITCARSSPKTGLTCSSNRSSTSSITARLPASGMCCTSGRSSSACLTFHSSGCPADAWKNPRIATPSRAHATPNAYSVSRRSSSDAIVRPGSNVTIRTMWERPSGPTTSAWNRPSSVGTRRMTGSVGSVRATWSSACVCMSITPGSSAGLPIFSTNPLPSSVTSLTFWSRSLTSGDPVASTPKTSAAIRSASAAPNAGGGESSGSSSPGTLVVSAAESVMGAPL